MKGISFQREGDCFREGHAEMGAACLWLLQPSHRPSRGRQQDGRCRWERPADLQNAPPRLLREYTPCAALYLRREPPALITDYPSNSFIYIKSGGPYDLADRVSLRFNRAGRSQYKLAMRAWRKSSAESLRSTPAATILRGWIGRWPGLGGFDRDAPRYHNRNRPCHSTRFRTSKRRRDGNASERWLYGADLWGSGDRLSEQHELAGI